MKGFAGHSWLTATTLLIGPVRPALWITESTAPTPSLVQYGRCPSTPSSWPTAMLREHTCVSRLSLPLSLLLLGSGNVSMMLSGPRLLPALDVGSYPAPASDGLVWKYFVIGSPLASVNLCPSNEDPTGVPFALTSDPSAWFFRPGSWATARITSG